MENGQEFVDYYDILQVDPNCDARILEIAYHYFAKMFHPDHAETADLDRFNRVVEAYGVLRDPAKREEYNQLYCARADKPARQVPIDSELEIDEKTALQDAEIHETILLHLYKRRREHASDPGVIGWLLQETLDCSDDQFEFHVWYLKSKGFIEITESSALAITIEGVDHVISASRNSRAAQLLIGQPGKADPGIDGGAE